MCGRFAMYSSLQDLLKYIKTESGQDIFKPSYNISPGQYAPAIKVSDNMLIIDKFKWGIDNTYKDKRSLLVNSRIETLTKRKNTDFIKCVIPANGFFEWKSSKKPYYCYSGKDPFLFFGGVCRKTADGDYFSIITRESKGVLQDIHHRMPLMMPENILSDWLSAGWDSLLPELDINDLKLHPVSPEVNRINTDNPDLIKEHQSAQLELFF